jgi:multisubunit Na+/H+ antiporter MnhG subunit
MSPREVVVVVLLALSVLLALFSALGVILSGSVFMRLHFMTPAAVIAPLLVGLAVIVRETFNIRGLQTIGAVLAMVTLGPILSHATARAARVRSRGDWPLERAKEPER